jgi:hypothetical protein
MYVTVPVAVQRGILFGAADADGLADEWARANTLWAPTMDETTRVAPSNTIHRFFTLNSSSFENLRPQSLAASLSCL